MIMYSTLQQDRVNFAEVSSQGTLQLFGTDCNARNDVSNRWSRGGVLRPTLVDEIPHPFWHRPSLGRKFWPLASYDSCACHILLNFIKGCSASVNLMRSVSRGQLSIPRHGRLMEATSKPTQAKANMSLIFVRRNSLFISRSSGAIHLREPMRLVVWVTVRVVSAKSASPKSAILAFHSWSTSMFA